MSHFFVKIEPGYTRWRGQILLELQMAIVALGKLQSADTWLSPIIQEFPMVVVVLGNLWTAEIS
jgi:hypothetical protein